MHRLEVKGDGTRDGAYGHSDDFGGDIFDRFDFYWDRSGFHEEPAESMQQIASRVGQRIEDLHVRDLMSRHLIAVSADDSLTVLAQRFLERHIHRVLVVEHGRLVGIVSALDLVRLFADKRVAPA